MHHKYQGPNSDEVQNPRERQEPNGYHMMNHHLNKILKETIGCKS